MVARGAAPRRDREGAAGRGPRQAPPERAGAIEPRSKKKQGGTRPAGWKNDAAPPATRHPAAAGFPTLRNSGAMATVATDAIMAAVFVQGRQAVKPR